MIQSEPLKQRCFEQYLLNILGFSVKLKFVALAYVSAQTQVKRFALKKIKNSYFFTSYALFSHVYTSITTFTTCPLRLFYQDHIPLTWCCFTFSKTLYILWLQLGSLQRTNKKPGRKITDKPP